MKRPSIRIAALAGAVTMALAATVAAAQPAPPGDILAGGLSNPRGLTAEGSDILVAEVGAGQITRISADGTTSVVVSGLPTTVFFSEETGTDEVAGPSAVIPVEGGYVITVSEGPDASMQSLYFAAEGQTGGSLMADLGAYEVANNTDAGLNIAGEADLLSNPYDVVAFGGGFLVSNSGANAVLRIDAEGNITPFAIFEARENPLFPNIGGPTMNQVPTGMVVGPDGAVYVSTLTGFPFPTGEARVYRLSDSNSDGDALDDGEMTVYADGLTTATDLAFDENGDLVVTEFSTNMLAQAPGRVVRVSNGNIEVIAGGVISPTGVIVMDGRVIVSQEFTGLVTDVTDAGAGAPPAAPTPANTGLGTSTTGDDNALLVLGLLAGAVFVTGASRRATAR